MGLSALLSGLFAFLLLPGSVLAVLLLLVVDLLEVELVLREAAVREVARDHHHEDPHVSENEQRHAKPHRLFHMSSR